MPPDGSLNLPYVIDAAEPTSELGQPSPAYDAFRDECARAAGYSGAAEADAAHAPRDPEFTPASTPPIYIDRTARKVLSLEPEADLFYGLLPGTNGTGPAMRRACVPPDFTWLTSDCKPARGVLLVPSDRSDDLETNPWSGRP